DWGVLGDGRPDCGGGEGGRGRGACRGRRAAGLPDGGAGRRIRVPGRRAAGLASLPDAGKGDRPVRSLPLKEILLGAGAAVVAYLAILGVNVRPAVFLAGVAWWVYQSVALRGPAAAVRSPAVTAVPPVRFEDIGGQEAAKQELLEAIE